jgi:glycosyltransferase involved in cell wall biosynthesis
VVHCHMFHANLLGRVTRLICSMPALICTVHNLRETSERGGSTVWKERLYRLTDALASRTTIICRAAFERYVHVGAVPRHRLEVIPNGIDVDSFQPDVASRARARASLGVDDRFVWLAVGRLVEQKDYPNLFAALTTLENEEFTVLIAGSGPLEAKLKAECMRLGLDSRVRFLGAREDIRDLYNAADAYVMSSEFEGFSIALLEAACTELPIVATDAGGNREIVQDGTSGHLVPLRHSALLASAMRQLMLSRESERRAMGKAGRAYCLRHFQIHAVLDKWIQLFVQCLDGDRQAVVARLASTGSEQ